MIVAGRAYHKSTQHDFDVEIILLSKRYQKSYHSGSILQDKSRMT